MRFWALGCALLWGCGGGDGGGGGTALVVLTFAGGTGAPLAGVTVTAGGASAVTDATGRANLALSSSGAIQIEARVAGRAPSSRVVKPAGARTFGVALVLHPVSLTTQVDVRSAPATLTVAAGVTLELPQGSLVTAAGQPPGGPVSAEITWVAPALGRAGAAPVALLAEEDGMTWPLTTYGMIEVSLSYQGQAVNLAAGAQATWRAPAQAADPASVDVFSADLARGLWVREGSATKQGSQYVAVLPHFSWHNLDLFGKVPADQWCCVRFVAKDKQGRAMAGVSIRTTTMLGTLDGSTDGDGTLCDYRFQCSQQLTLDWGAWLDGSARKPVIGQVTVTPNARGVMCASPQCQEVPIKVACSEHDHCKPGEECVLGICGGSAPPPDGGTSGTVRSCNKDSLDVCNEFRGSGFSASQVMQACADNMATYAAAPCPSTGVVGRCIDNRGTPGESHFVYYSPTFTGMTASLRQVCTASPRNGTWQDF